MIDRLCLNVSEPTSLQFYRDLGMEVRNLDEFSAVLGFPDQTESLELRFWDQERPAPKYRPSNQDGYWKIGVTVADVRRLADRLQSQGWSTSEPAQFRDIGFLCHAQDPDGLTVELLQHTFEENFRPVAEEVPRLGQVTLRISDPGPSLEFYRSLGLKLLSVQKVEPYRFTLYFLAATEDEPPDPDLESVDNREWLWQRPYTTLELQHRWDSPANPAGAQDLGFQALHLTPPVNARDPDGHQLG